ncbi:MAG: hypothetical protein GXP39_06505 [Chloroflexi bacterium]|nr:hypothetical protein [Chloroflexota bacterium]
MGAEPILTWLDRLLASMTLLDGFLSVLALAVLTAIVLISADWRLTVAGLAGQSVILAGLATRYLPLEWAFARMIVGLLIAIMWLLSAWTSGWGRRPVRWLRWRWPLLSTRGLLRLVMVILVAILLLTLRLRLPLPGLDGDLVFLSTWLIAMGLLTLALSEEPLTGGMGLIWWIEAFQLYYPALERDAVIEGTMGIVKLLIGLACAYLITVEGLRLDISPGEEW